jgi:hypothetical protein
MLPLVALAGSILVAEAYKQLATPQQKRKWENFVKMHHGEAGAILTAAGILTRSPSLAASGIGLMAHDWKDRNDWFSGSRQKRNI